MKKLLSIILVLALCWPMLNTIMPARNVDAVQTGTAALEGERYTVDWEIPPVGDANVFTAGSAGSAEEKSIAYVEYDILGYVSPKYADSHVVGSTGNPETDPLGELSDGAVGSEHYLNDQWVGMYGNEDNAIYIDLGEYRTDISSIHLQMLSSPKEGIFLPSNITVAVSEDGITYNKAGDFNWISGNVGGNIVTAGYIVPTEYRSVVYDVYFEAPQLFKAQYIMLIFEHADGTDGFNRCWTFLSEVTVNYTGTVIIPDFTGANQWPLYAIPTDNVHHVNVGKNSVYQIAATVGKDDHPDAGRIQLTDDIMDTAGEGWNNSSYVSIVGSDNKIAIQLDLGVEQENISQISLFGNTMGNNAHPISSVAVYASNDNSNFGIVGTSGASGTDRYQLNYTIPSNQGFTARYITLVITPDTGDNIYLDEIQIITTNESTERINLAASDGAKYMYIDNTTSIGKTANDTRYLDDKWTGSKADGVPALNVYATGDINDGIKGTSTYIDPAWAGYNYSSVTGTVDIVFDLGKKQSKINSVQFTLLEYSTETTGTTCSVPADFTVWYSDSDSSFSNNTKGSITESVVVSPIADKKVVFHNYEAQLNNISARYVKISIPKQARELLIDEIEIFRGIVISDDAELDIEGYKTLNYMSADDSLPNGTMSAVWLSYVALPALYLKDGYQVDEVTYRARLNDYLDNMADGGINTIMLHTRSHGDRLYGGPNTKFGNDDSATSISPISSRYTGDSAINPAYDALEIFIEVAHQKGLSVQSWVNPLRLETTAKIEQWDNNLPAKKMYLGNYNGNTATDMVGIVANYWWLNIAYPEVRQYIVDAIMEPLYMYQFDGVIIDDYFYPEGATLAFDATAYAKFCPNDSQDLAVWRRSNTDELVKLLYKTIKTYKESLIFGISPFGNNIAYSDGYNNSYHMNQMYADVRKWATEEWTDPVTNKKYKYMDYLSPQLYWGFTSTAGAEFGSVTTTGGSSSGFERYFGADGNQVFVVVDEGGDLYTNRGTALSDLFDDNPSLKEFFADRSHWLEYTYDPNNMDNNMYYTLDEHDLLPNNMWGPGSNSYTYYEIHIRPHEKRGAGKTVTGLIGEWSDLTKDGLVKLVPSLGIYMAFGTLNTARDDEYKQTNVIKDQLNLMSSNLFTDVTSEGSDVLRYYEVGIVQNVYRRGSWTRTWYGFNSYGLETGIENDSTGTAISVGSAGTGGGEVTNSRVWGQILYSSDTFYTIADPSGNRNEYGYYRTNDYIDTNRHQAIRNELIKFWQGELKTNWTGE